MDLIKLVIAWTLVGAFIFTVVVTCLSLVGLVRFQEGAQQKKLFWVLIVELVVGCVGAFLDGLRFNPVRVQGEVEDKTLAVCETWLAKDPPTVQAIGHRLSAKGADTEGAKLFAGLDGIADRLHAGSEIRVFSLDPGSNRLRPETIQQPRNFEQVLNLFARLRESAEAIRVKLASPDLEFGARASLQSELQQQVALMSALENTFRSAPETQQLIRHAMQLARAQGAPPSATPR